MQNKTSLRAQREGRSPQDAELEPHLLSVEKIKQSISIFFFLKQQQHNTLRYHFTVIRMSFIKKNTNKKHWQGGEARGTLVQQF